MRKAWFVTVLAVFTAALAVSSGVAVASPTSLPGVNSAAALASDEAGIQDVAVCYQVRTVGGWGGVKCGVNGADGPAAGCSGCELEAIAADATVSIWYKVRTAGGWGDWKFNGEAAGCFGCKIEAMQLEHGPGAHVEYRVRTAGGWGVWRSDGETAGCVGCTVEAIQMRIF